MHFNDYYQGHNTTDYKFQAQFLDLSSCIIVSRPSKRGEKNSAAFRDKTKMEIAQEVGRFPHFKHHLVEMGGG